MAGTPEQKLLHYLGYRNDPVKWAAYLKRKGQQRLLNPSPAASVPTLYGLLHTNEWGVIRSWAKSMGFRFCPGISSGDWHFKPEHEFYFYDRSYPYCKKCASFRNKRKYLFWKMKLRKSA